MTTNYYAFNTMFRQMKYPAGESHINLNVEWETLTSEFVMEMECRSFDDLGVLLTADRLLKEHRKTPTWFVPYFPFARQDRRTDEWSGFELSLALDLVKDIDIVIVDPHSDVAGLLPHIQQKVFVKQLKAVGGFRPDQMVVIPDRGATSKALSWLGKHDFIQGEKHRDPTTGRLSGFSVPDKDLAGRPCIIVDDICDGGGTFIGLAEKLKEKGAGDLTLAVTHGLFTKGIGLLLQKFDRIYACSYSGKPTVYPSTIGIPFEKLWNTQS